jgi:hypothetical protein
MKKFIPSILQMSGAMIICVAVASISTIGALVLAGSFILLFGIALERSR